MHGRVKERTSEEKKALIKKQQQVKLKAYTQGINTIFSQRKSRLYDENIFLQIGKLLSNNPDLNTLWNIRREILLDGKEQIKQELVQNELYLTEECLRTNPKSYSAWHHRCWVLDNCPEPDWQKEINLCAKYLKLDERNFHCWDYRQFIVSRAKVSYENELKFSTEKILHNFSNYSSWHYRSILYKTLSPESSLFKEELDLVQNATFTDPSDTSAWFYQRWLLGQKYIPLKIVLAVVSDTTLVVSLTKGTNEPPCIYKNKEKLKVQLKSLDESSKYSAIWISYDGVNDACLERDLIQIGLTNNQLIDLTYDQGSNEARYYEKNLDCLGVNFSDELRPTIFEQLKSCRELLELEPDSKWTLLTTALLLRGLGGSENNKESIDLVEKLKEFDKLRRGYYDDLRSQWVIDDLINDKIKNGSLFDDFILDDQNVIALYSVQYFLGSRNIRVRSHVLYKKLVNKFSKLPRNKSFQEKFASLMTRPGQENQPQDDAPWWMKYAARGLGTFGSGVAILFGLYNCFGMVFGDVDCLLGGMWQMLAGFLVIICEAPCCCLFVDFVQQVSDYVERRPHWNKAVGYMGIAVPPILFCPGLGSLCGSGLIFGTGVIYGMIALGKKASAEEMRNHAIATGLAPQTNSQSTVRVPPSSGMRSTLVENAAPISFTGVPVPNDSNV